MILAAEGSQHPYAIVKDTAGRVAPACGCGWRGTHHPPAPPRPLRPAPQRTGGKRVTPQWKGRLVIRDVWRNEDMTFEQRRDEIVRRIRKAPWGNDDWRLGEIVDGLTDAEDAPEFDEWWSEFYDWADDKRVWVAIA